VIRREKKESGAAANSQRKSATKQASGNGNAQMLGAANENGSPSVVYLSNGVAAFQHKSK